MPSISELLAQYRDRTGASYDEMSRSVQGAITSAWFHKLTTMPPRSFPRDPATIQQLADLLQVPVPTILAAFAVSLGLNVPDSQPLLALTLPPGTDSLTERDRAAVRAVIASLVEARRSAAPGPDLYDPAIQGRRLAERDGQPAPSRPDR